MPCARATLPEFLCACHTSARMLQSLICQSSDLVKLLRASMKRVWHLCCSLVLPLHQVGGHQLDLHVTVGLMVAGAVTPSKPDWQSKTHAQTQNLTSNSQLHWSQDKDLYLIVGLICAECLSCMSKDMEVQQLSENQEACCRTAVAWCWHMTHADSSWHERSCICRLQP